MKAKCPNPDCCRTIVDFGNGSLRCPDCGQQMASVVEPSDFVKERPQIVLLRETALIDVEYAQKQLLWAMSHSKDQDVSVLTAMNNCADGLDRALEALGGKK